MTPTKASGIQVSPRLRLAALLAVSFCLRIWLSLGGGQLFWPDESRYSSAQHAAEALVHGQWHEALVQLFAHADHVLFRLMSLPAALMEVAAGNPLPVLVSAYFSLFSVGLVFLIWAVARRAGASEREALWAAFFAATSNCLFFYSRHFLPYDVALFELFLALWLALGPWSAGNSLRVGLVVALGFLTYNGYWLLGGSVLVLHVLYGNGLRAEMLRRAAWAAAGFGLTVGVVVALGASLSKGLMGDYQSFSGTIKQGDFRIGYRVISEYLWYSERGILLIWLGAIGYALCSSRARPVSRRLGIWLTGAGIMVGGLLLFSDVVPQFMVYGRLARGVVPFLCLGAGTGMACFLEARPDSGERVGPRLVAFIALLAAFNFSTPLFQVFPETFNERAVGVIAQQRAQGIGFYRVLFAESLWGKHLDIKLPPHTELLRSPHPMQFRPFQYEGFSAELREEINRNDVAMQVVEMPFEKTEESRRWEGYPGPVRVKLMFQPDYWNEQVPLVSSGIPGKGDLVRVTYLDPDHLSLGLIHSGGPDIDSDPIKLDYREPHEVVISEGPLVPPRGSALYKDSPELEGLRDRIVILLDGAIVLSRPAEFHPSTPESLAWGVNAMGALTPQPELKVPVYEFGSAPLDEVATAVPTLAAFRLAQGRPPEWRGALGPVRLRFAMAPASPAVTAEPLLSVNGPGTKDVIFIARVGSDKVRIGFDRLGAGAILSEPIKLSGTGTEELDVSLGSLLPALDSSLYSQYPGFASMRGEAYVRFNGVTALHASAPFNAAAAHWFTLGANTIGSSTYGPDFRGNISYFGTIGPDNIPGFGTKLSGLVDNPDSTWAGFTGPLRLRVVFPRGRAGHNESLISSGKKGASDTLFVHYDSDRSIRFGYARTGDPDVLTRPVAIEPGAIQELLLSSGALMPPEKSELYSSDPELDALRSFIHVGLNGKPLLHEYAEPFPAGDGAIWIGASPLVDADGDGKFQGTVESITRTRPMDVFEDGALGKSFARPGWQGYPGPLRIRMTFPRGSPGEGQPIVTTGLRGIGDILFLRYGANGMARVGQDHWGSQLLLSAPFELTVGVPHTLVVSFGALYPPSDTVLVSAPPELGALRKKTVVLFDGQPVLSSDEPSHPSAPENITVGANLIGGTTARSLFSGVVDQVLPASLDAVGP